MVQVKAAEPGIYELQKQGFLDPSHNATQQSCLVKIHIMHLVCKTSFCWKFEVQGLIFSDLAELLYSHK